MSNRVAILITGAEVLDGRVSESNSHYLIRELALVGVSVNHVLSCGDSIPEIKASLEFLSRDSSVIIVSGGLGPTTDDLTREAIAEFSDTKLVLQGDVLARLEHYFRKKQRPFDPSNCKQALFPEGAVTIDNPVGSALGFSMRPHLDRRALNLIIALPGVPRELYAMTEGSVLSLVKREIGAIATLEKRVFRVFGLGESMIGTRVQNSEPSSDVEISYRAHFPEVEVVFKSKHRTHLSSSVKRAKEAIGREYVYSTDPKVGLDGVVHDILVKKKLTIATAESCTAGMVSAMLTNTPGSSEYFLGGVLSYSNEVKIRELGVSAKTLRAHGAVSRETACEMARGVWSKFKSGLGVSVTGIAGPNGGSPAKPVGTFYVGLCTGKNVSAYRFFLNSSRGMIRSYAAWVALDVVRRHLLKLQIHEHKK